MKKWLSLLRDAYIIAQVRRPVLPEFPDEPLRRYRIVFSGRVQKVGFRLELCQMSRRLGLTGFCKNLENGGVLAEIQGSDSKIRYLLTFMESLKRIQIQKMAVTALQCSWTEKGFYRR